MKKDSVDIKICINIAIDNAEKRIKSLEKGDQTVSYTHLTLPTTPYV